MIRVETYEWGHEGLVRGSDGLLHDGWVSNQADSAGGVSVRFSVENYGTKPVKSYSIYFAPYNGASEPVRCTITNLCVKGVSSYDLLGPNGVSRNNLFKNAWYNNSIRSVVVDHIDVRYSDGTTESSKGNYKPTDSERSASVSSGIKSSVLQLLVGLLSIAAILGLIWYALSGFYHFVMG